MTTLVTERDRDDAITEAARLTTPDEVKPAGFGGVGAVGFTTAPWALGPPASPACFAASGGFCAWLMAESVTLTWTCCV